MSVSGRRPNVVEEALLALGDTPILTIPCLDGPREGHWLRYWDDLPNVRRIDLPYWSYPRRDAWMDVLGEAIGDVAGGAMVVGHGLGCVALSIWATLARPAHLIGKIGGALLVSPVDPGSEAADPRCAEFRPVPSLALPFPSLLVNAGDDGRGAALARLWGSRRADPVRHREAERGPWPEGLRLLASLSRARAQRPEPVAA
jgi:predicted alpha/beta hydrolase family esterase